MKYYPINEDLARRANEMNSYFEYVPGRATQSYRAEVDEAAARRERCSRTRSRSVAMPGPKQRRLSSV